MLGEPENQFSLTRSETDAAAGDLVLSWPGTTGYYYSVWQTPILSPAAWATVTGKTNLAGVTGLNAVTVRLDWASLRCYRVGAQR